MNTTNGQSDALRALVFQAFDDLEAGKDRGTVQCELIAALTPPVHGDGPVAGDADVAFWADRLDMLGDMHNCGGGTMKVCARMLRDLAALHPTEARATPAVTDAMCARVFHDDWTQGTEFDRSLMRKRLTAAMQSDSTEQETAR